jgi:hypothetical protein
MSNYKKTGDNGDDDDDDGLPHENIIQKRLRIGKHRDQYVGTRPPIDNTPISNTCL